MAKKNVSRWTKEELDARNAIRRQNKQAFEEKLVGFVNNGTEVFTKDDKAYILRVFYNIGQDLAMQIENLSNTEGTLRQVKENHLASIRNVMNMVITKEAAGEFHTRSTVTSMVDEFFHISE